MAGSLKAHIGSDDRGPGLREGEKGVAAQGKEMDGMETRGRRKEVQVETEALSYIDAPKYKQWE